MTRIHALVAIAVLCLPQSLPAQQRGARSPRPATGAPATSASRAGEAGGTQARAAEFERAAADLAAGRRSLAAAEYRTIAQKYGSVRALLQLARIQSGDGDAPGALASLGRARELAPNSEDVLSAYGQVALAARSLPRASEALNALRRLYPDVAQHHYLYGIAHMQVGDMITAADALREADRIEPDRPLTLIALGLALNNRKLYSDAIAPLSRALELEPGNLEGLAAISEAEEGLGNAVDAETHARRVLAARPDHATANLVLGLVLMRAERYAEARDALLRASAADPASPKPDYQLSLAYARLGDAASSQKYLQLYQQKLRDVEKRLNELRTQGGSPGGV